MATLEPPSDGVPEIIADLADQIGSLRLVVRDLITLQLGTVASFQRGSEIITVGDTLFEPAALARVQRDAEEGV
jgi:hypothetical protein